MDKQNRLGDEKRHQLSSSLQRFYKYNALIKIEIAIVWSTFSFLGLWTWFAHNICLVSDREDGILYYLWFHIFIHLQSFQKMSFEYVVNEFWLSFSFHQHAQFFLGINAFHTNSSTSYRFDHYSWIEKARSELISVNPLASFSMPISIEMS